MSIECDHSSTKNKANSAPFMNRSGMKNLSTNSRPATSFKRRIGRTMGYLVKISILALCCSCSKLTALTKNTTPSNFYDFADTHSNDSAEIKLTDLRSEQAKSKMLSTAATPETKDPMVIVTNSKGKLVEKSSKALLKQRWRNA
jgi:hypothetical protein